MGEAKARGTFEERKKAAQKRNEEERQKRLKEKAIRLAQETPEEKKQRLEADAAFLGLAAMAGPYMFNYTKSIR